MVGVAQGDSATTDQIDQGADRRTERALVAYVRQELSAPAIAIMGYAEMLMDDAVQSDRGQLIDDLQRILDASRTLHRLILSLLDPAAIHQTDAQCGPGRNTAGSCATTCARRLTRSRATEKCCARTRQSKVRKRWSPISTSSWERQL